MRLPESHHRRLRQRHLWRPDQRSGLGRLLDHLGRAAGPSARPLPHAEPPTHTPAPGRTPAGTGTPPAPPSGAALELSSRGRAARGACSPAVSAARRRADSGVEHTPPPTPSRGDTVAGGCRVRLPSSTDSKRRPAFYTGGGRLSRVLPRGPHLTKNFDRLPISTCRHPRKARSGRHTQRGVQPRPRPRSQARAAQPSRQPSVGAHSRPGLRSGSQRLRPRGRGSSAPPHSSAPSFTEKRPSLNAPKASSCICPGLWDTHRGDGSALRPNCLRDNPMNTHTSGRVIAPRCCTSGQVINSGERLRFTPQQALRQGMGQVRAGRHCSPPHSHSAPGRTKEVERRSDPADRDGPWP